jgi:hypothetical protein
VISETLTLASVVHLVTIPAGILGDRPVLSGIAIPTVDEVMGWAVDRCRRLVWENQSVVLVTPRQLCQQAIAGNPLAWEMAVGEPVVSSGADDLLEAIRRHAVSRDLLWQYRRLLARRLDAVMGLSDPLRRIRCTPVIRRFGYDPEEVQALAHLAIRVECLATTRRMSSVPEETGGTVERVVQLCDRAFAAVAGSTVPENADRDAIGRALIAVHRRWL